MTKIKVLELFSGINGFRLGIEQAYPNKFEFIGQSEIDKYALQISNKNYKNYFNYGNITKINWDTIPDIDLIAGGSPCQDLSIAGKRQGLKGERSGLFYHFLTAIKKKKPKYFIWENVKGALSSNKGWDFAEVLNSFSEAGYTLQWQVLNSKDFGVPQNRERIFVIGSRGQPIPKVFPIGGTDEETKIQYVTKSDKKDYRTFSKNGIAPGLQARSDTHKLECLHKGDYQSRRVYSPKGLSPTIPTSCGGHHLPFIAAERGRYNKDGTTSQKLEARKDNISNTLTGVEKDNRVIETVGLLKESEKPKGNYLPRERVLNGKKCARAVTTNQSQMPYYTDKTRIRRLTPTECMRLQGFPDSWCDKGINEKGEEVEISDSQKYKCAGNAVTVNVIKAIIKKLL